MIINAHRRTCKAALSILLTNSKNYRKPFSRRKFSLKTETSISKMTRRFSDIWTFVMGMIYELDNYVAFFKEETKDLTSQVSKRLGQSYLLLILNSSEHSFKVFLSLSVLVHFI